MPDPTQRQLPPLVGLGCARDDPSTLPCLSRPTDTRPGPDGACSRQKAGPVRGGGWGDRHRSTHSNSKQAYQDPPPMPWLARCANVTLPRLCRQTQSTAVVRGSSTPHAVAAPPEGSAPAARLRVSPSFIGRRPGETCRPALGVSSSPPVGRGGRRISWEGGVGRETTAGPSPVVSVSSSGLGHETPAPSALALLLDAANRSRQASCKRRGSCTDAGVSGGRRRVLGLVSARRGCCSPVQRPATSPAKGDGWLDGSDWLCYEGGQHRDDGRTQRLPEVTLAFMPSDIH